MGFFCFFFTSFSLLFPPGSNGGRHVDQVTQLNDAKQDSFTSVSNGVRLKTADWPMSYSWCVRVGSARVVTRPAKRVASTWLKTATARQSGLVPAEAPPPPRGSVARLAPPLTVTSRYGGWSLRVTSWLMPIALCSSAFSAWISNVGAHFLDRAELPDSRKFYSLGASS